MKLLLALYLLSSYFCSVFMLQCLKCSSDSGQCKTTLSEQCEEDHVCVSATHSLFLPGVIGIYKNVNESGVKRECMPRWRCDMFNPVVYSANVGMAYGSLFLSCCESDNCNSITIPELNNKPNGLKCLTCDSFSDNVCNSVISCVGSQDHCLRVKGPFFPLGSEKIMGCMSKPFCDLLSDTYSLDQVQCCSGNLCNKV